MWKCASQLAGGSTSVGREGWASGGAQVGMLAPAICISGIVIPDNHSVADRGNCRGGRPLFWRGSRRGGRFSNGDAELLDHRSPERDIAVDPGFEFLAVERAAQLGLLHVFLHARRMNGSQRRLLKLGGNVGRKTGGRQPGGPVFPYP